jgi:hypothetical protein
MSLSRVGLRVGSRVGFLGLPDTHRPCGINGLSLKCRVCRVFRRVERPEEFVANRQSMKTEVLLLLNCS